MAPSRSVGVISCSFLHSLYIVTQLLEILECCYICALYNTRQVMNYLRQLSPSSIESMRAYISQHGPSLHWADFNIANKLAHSPDAPDAYEVLIRGLPKHADLNKQTDQQDAHGSIKSQAGIMAGSHPVPASPSTSSSSNRVEMQSPPCDRPFAFVDLGANDGDTYRRWFHQENFPNQANLTRTLASKYGTTGELDDFCYIGVEPNPRWEEKLAQLKGERLDDPPSSRVFLTHTAAGTSWGQAPLFLDAWKSGIGSSVNAKKNMFVAGGSVNVTLVPLVALLQQLKHESPSLKGILLKMDIETSEYDVLPSLIETPEACAFVDILLLEWHTGKTQGRSKQVDLKMQDEIAKALRAPPCGVTLLDGNWANV